MTVNNDKRVERDEYFYVNLVIGPSAVEPTVSNSRVQINITDADSELLDMLKSGTVIILTIIE